MRKITTLLFALCVAVSMAQAKSQASSPANKPNIQPDAQRPIATRLKNSPALVKAARDNDLEKEGFISRKQFNEIPPHVEYSFTQKGLDLMPVFYEMTKWGYKYADEKTK